MLQMKMMEVYREHGVNPLGGCLPVLIQLPFFIAIFVTLNSEAFRALIAQEGVSASFLWLSDLSAPDKTLILPILVALSTYVSQQTMTTGASKNDPQMKMMAYMPLIMLFISLQLPAGVLIYWSISQFITALQQYALTRPDKQTSTRKATKVSTQSKPKIIETTAETIDTKKTKESTEQQRKQRSNTRTRTKTSNKKKTPRQRGKKGA